MTALEPDYQEVDTSDIVPPTFVTPHDYKVSVYETMTGEFVTDLPATYFNYTHVINKPGAAEIHFPIRDNKGSIDATTLGALQKLVATDIEEFAYSVLITTNGVCEWGGFWSRTRASSFDNRVTAACVGFWDYFRNRHIRSTRIYTNQDVLAITRALVDHAQVGSSYDIGVATGAEVSGTTASLTINAHDFKTYADAIEDLAFVDASRFDFRIEVSLDSNGEVSKLLRLGAPRLGTRRSFVADYSKNLTTYSWERDGSSRPTVIYGIGAGEGASTVVVQAGDSSSFGRVPVREAIITRKDIPKARTWQLQGLATTEARKYSSPVEVASITLHGDGIVGSFNAGDSVSIKIDDGFVQVDKYMRVLSYTVRVQDNAERTVDVELGPEFATGG